MPGNRVSACETALRAVAREEIRALADAYPGERTLEIDLHELVTYPAAGGFDARGLVEDVLQDPGLMQESFEEALQAVAMADPDVEVSLATAHVRFTNLPDGVTMTVGDERVADGDLGTLRGFEGQVTKRTEVLPKLDVGVFRCLACGVGEDRIEQGFGGIREPGYCEECGPNARWHLSRERSEWVDYQKVRIQQPPEEAVDGATANLDVHLVDDLVGELEGGQRVTMNAELQAISNKGLAVHDKVLVGNSYEREEEVGDDLDLSAYREGIDELQADPRVFDRLVDALVPSHQGGRHLKEAVVLQLFGGWPRTAPDGTYHRGDSHVFFVGDPGVGKTVILKAAAGTSPRGIMTDGTGSSSAGLTASLVRDDFSDEQWSIEAGALVRGNKGLAAIDELAKGNESDLAALHTALESQEVIVSKAGKHAHLPARTAVLAADNPTGGHIDPTRDIVDQVALQSPLLSRFDLIFVARERVQEARIRPVAEHMVDARYVAGRLAKGEEIPPEERAVAEAELDRDLLRAYIAYAKREVQPVPRDEAIKQQMKDYYTNLKLSLPDRYSAAIEAEEETGTYEGPPLPVTARKLDAVMRLAEASARTRCSETIVEDDVDRATRLIERSLADLGIEPAEGSALGRTQQDLDAEEIGL